MQTIILAGGRGIRLDPFSRILPKPLFPIGDKPIAEILVEQLKLAGVQEIIMCLGYLADLMKLYFQDGSYYDLTIRYSLETTPLGTAGPLRLVDNLEDNFLVVNGDELTTLDFRRLYDHHLATKADMTVAVHKKSVSSSFGVLETKDGQIISYSEKPSMDYWASMGIYVVNKRILPLIPENQRFDMPDLVQRLLLEQAKVVSYESQDLWFDIGTMADLEKAKEQFDTVRFL
ncbi:Nucleoside-diphosphate-sugar pyrophosphorylase family protein [Desulfosporosinus acidiphilus SJ4]|uniref:Nucleoside-diphosphate-sugar pyrophosphorylase family protein n=1 Tax=Desulfosporosinus acidiphilus (strain DSM 22704 / JCM 16185 / SJ4) TaxID=646529 RepID=I4D1K0_DESAJ|nr:sugar phosphate nucleotidyltransferase [Desulfosporosinus acidiphilus]AFM39674.1 Nucleoside-diphosphate-sugar pyrophosphorylase family protein [Desulfosporosinus acidiphilus SJ4]